MKYLLFFVFTLSVNATYSQDKDYEILGKALAKSIVTNDSIAFYDLVLPEDAAIEFFKSMAGDEITAEDLEMATEAIRSNYEEIVTSTFALSFFNLTTKADIFKLNLSNVTYEIVETDDTKDLPNVMAIHGSIDHYKFQHFTFYAIAFEDQLYVASHLISISETNAFKTRDRLQKVDISADENGHITCRGSIELEDQSTPKKAILNCLVDAPIFIGVDETSQYVDEELEQEYIRGQWEYGYYVNNTSDFAGNVEFSYEIKISDGIIHYNYYNFMHRAGDSEFKSIGILPLEINDKVLKIFTEKQYKEIIGDLKFNHVVVVKRIMEVADKCF